MRKRIRKMFAALLALLTLFSLAPAAAFAASGTAPLRSVAYVLDDPSDGYANGTVTVDRGSSAAEDCVMYWADGSGTPLEGLAPLAKFRLTGTVTEHGMYPYTIIPEGAEKLIAYASSGGVLSDTAVSCDLPEGSAYGRLGEPLAEFRIMSDTHVTSGGAGGEVALANEHFARMLEDTAALSPDCDGIFINGDIANNGAEAEYQKVWEMWQDARNRGLSVPLLHLAVGNHDWNQGNPDSRFQRWVKTFNPGLPAQPEHVYYDETVAGYHFVYLGGEQSSLSAVLSQEQLDWFDAVMRRCTDEDPGRPVFVFLHQSFYNTVAGSLPGQGWHGVTNEDALKAVLEKYGQIVYFNGHSHWELDSERCVYGGDDQVPAALNTAAVGYLWSSYNKTSGEFAPGSNAYQVKVYSDRIAFLGREFETGTYVPSAMFVIRRNEITTDQETYEVPVDIDCAVLRAESENGGKLTFRSADPEVAEIRADGTIVPKSIGQTRIGIRSTADDTRVIGWKTVTVRVTGSAEADHEEIIRPATCEEDGILRIWYRDGTYLDTRIPATGHAWGGWTYNNDRHSHSRVCANDPSHTQTAECSFVQHSGGGRTVYTCPACGGSYTVEMLSTDKTVYGVGEPVMVSTDYSGSDAWVGLYRKGETWGSVKSIFWYYLREQSSPVNILATRDENGRAGDYGPGEFSVVLFSDGGYNAIAQVDITVRQDSGSGHRITVEDHTGGTARTSLEPDRLYSGDVSFTVSADAACLAAVKQADGTWQALGCQGGGGTFTVTVGDSDVTVALAYRGDANLDGKVSAKDATLCKRFWLGLEDFTEDAALQALAADVNRDGGISVRDATAIKQAVLGIADIPW